ncbi:MAG: ribosome biogenesis GTP-binding protein YihA/YsxC [Oscillospiraceae bacterium]
MNIHDVTFERSFGLSEQLSASDRPEFVFMGRSNVGKSSLINRLMNRKSLARVSATPGKTATINFYRAGEVRLVDLPGYGYAKVAKGEHRRYSELIGGYFAGDRDVVLVFLLIDMRHPPTVDDLSTMDFLMREEMPFVVVLTKSDKLNKTQRAVRLADILNELPCEGVTLIPFSSETGEGLEALREIVGELSEPDDLPQ